MPDRPRYPSKSQCALCGLIFAAMLVTSCTARGLVTGPFVTPEIVDDDGPVSSSQAERVVKKVARDAPDPESFAGLLAIIDSIDDTPLYKDNRAELLIDGPETYRYMLAEIGQAQDFIHLETYIFADDDIGQRFANALIARSRDGVAVRIIYDSIGSMGSSEPFFERMQDAGIELIEYNNINPIEGGNPLSINTRNHRKLLVVDGRVAFTGGINFSNSYASSASSSPPTDPLVEGWRDTHVAVYGPAVHGFEHSFESQWRALGGALDAGDVEMPKAEKAGSDLIAVLDAEGGDNVESPIYRAYIEAIKVGQERVWITQAYFAPDKSFMDELKNAARRGVDVQVIVPGVSDHDLVLNASRSRYGDLLEAGVKICENVSSLLHAKTAVIDGIWSTVGSSNLDYRSFLHNDEVNAMIFGTDFADQMEEQFRLDLEDCRMVTLAEWKNRSLLDRLKEFLSWPLEYWL